MNGYSTPTLRAMARARHLALAPVVWTVMLTAASSQAQSVSGSLGIHDPSTVVKSNGKYFLYGTGTGISSKQSSDHFTWSDGPPVFTSAPSWIAAAVPANSNLNYWAPDVAYFNNLYHLYYSVSTFGSQVSGIGLATSPTLDPADPSYHWSDQGAVIQSTNGSSYNTIDPSIAQTPDGHVWMSFGSYWNGIYMTELDPTSGKRLTPNSPTISVARHLPLNPDSIEASYIYQHNGYYYMFANWDTCCQGVNSTYNIRVGRSTSVTGPFLDPRGVNMVNGGGSLFLGTEGRYIGPGHIGIFEDQGVDWFGYHFYDGNAGGAPTFNLRTLLWSADGWPIAGPSTAPSPADLNLDGLVDVADYITLKDHMTLTGVSHADGDMDGDGDVDFFDFHAWKSIYLSLPGASADSLLAVPEPPTAYLLIWGAAGTAIFCACRNRGRATIDSAQIFGSRSKLQWTRPRLDDPAQSPNFIQHDEASVRALTS
jgi:arabinan endo-1,5-alpha-L-arabinosidase